MIRSLKKLAAAVAFTTSCSVHAFVPNEIVVFGDSLSDSGYGDTMAMTVAANPFTLMYPVEGMKLMKKATHTSPAYGNPESGLAENGKVWTEQLAELMNEYVEQQELTQTSYNLTAITNNKVLDETGYPTENVCEDLFCAATGNSNGNNYAAGGAVTSGEGIGMDIEASIGGLTGVLHYHPPSVHYQVSSYLSQHQNNQNSDNLYIIWAGANNLLKLVSDYDGDGLMDGQDGVPITTEQQLYKLGKKVAEQAVLDIKTEVERLKSQAGAQHILLINMPRLDLTPMAVALANQYEGIEEIDGTPVDFSTIKTTLLSATKGFNAILSHHLAGDPAIKVIDIAREMGIMVKEHGYEVAGKYFEFPNVDGTACKPLVVTDDQGKKDGILYTLSTSALSCSPEINIVDNQLVKVAQPATGYIFEDNVHPTSRLHEAIAHKIKEIIIYEM